MVIVFSWKVFLEFWVYDQNDKELKKLREPKKIYRKVEWIKQKASAASVKQPQLSYKTRECLVRDLIAPTKSLKALTTSQQ